jgi:hypothetical protein
LNVLPAAGAGNKSSRMIVAQADNGKPDGLLCLAGRSLARFQPDARCQEDAKIFEKPH